jgi:hypothetical protein
VVVKTVSNADIIPVEVYVMEERTVVRLIMVGVVLLAAIIPATIAGVSYKMGYEDGHKDGHERGAFFIVKHHKCIDNYGSYAVRHLSERLSRKNGMSPQNCDDINLLRETVEKASEELERKLEGWEKE